MTMTDVRDTAIDVVNALLSPYRVHEETTYTDEPTVIATRAIPLSTPGQMEVRCTAAVWDGAVLQSYRIVKLVMFTWEADVLVVQSQVDLSSNEGSGILIDAAITIVAEADHLAIEAEGAIDTAVKWQTITILNMATAPEIET